MIATAATLLYDPMPPLVMALASDQQNVLARDQGFVRGECPSVTTIQYGRFTPHFNKLKKLQADSTLWPSEAEQPSADALGWGRSILLRLFACDVLPARVIASAEGGVAVCFVDGDRYADIESHNSGVILGVLSNKRNRPTVWEVERSADGIARAVQRIGEFIHSS